MNFEDKRICDLCDRTVPDTFGGFNACCGFHNLPNSMVKHTHHCDRREKVRQSLKRARHLKKEPA